MAGDTWLPKGYVTSQGATLRALRYHGEQWQIFTTRGGGDLLLALAPLVERWHCCGLLAKQQWQELSVSGRTFYLLAGGPQQELRPVSESESFVSREEALAFAQALQASRRLCDASFHDAIYVAAFSRLLPAWTDSAAVDDRLVLGHWLSGGVHVSTEDFPRLRHLTGWMPADELQEVIRAAGLAGRQSAHLQSARQSARTPPDAEQEKTDAGAPFILPGRPLLEQFFNEHVIDIVQNRQQYQAMGIDSPAAIVLHGPPGCGKTFAVEKLIAHLDWPTFSIDSGSIGSPYIHETGKKISQLFDQAIAAAPSVLVIDEMEAFLTDRRISSSAGSHHAEEMAEFLRRIPQAIEQQVLIIAMTNLIDTIDPAILRRGRFDHIIEIAMPCAEEVEALLNALLAKLPHEEHLDLQPLVTALTGCALSDSAFVVREAGRLTARAGKARLDQQCLEQALKRLPGQDEAPRRIGFI